MLNRRALALATGAAAAIILGSLSPLAATAAPPEDKEQLRHERAVSYWTAERIANARPMDLLRVDPKTGKIQPQGKGGCNKRNPCDGDDSGGSDGSGGSGDDTEPIVDPDDPTQLTATTSQSWIESNLETTSSDAPVVTGKVFFTEGNWNYVCSGSVVTDGDNFDDKALILTAGHCVNDGPDEWVTNWTFMPDYGDEAPEDAAKDCSMALGCWTASNLITSSTWASSDPAFADDFGFARVGVGGHEGKPLEEVLAAVGAEPAPIAFNQSRNEFLAGFGYPAGRPYDGRALYYCAGDVTNPNDDPGRPLGIPCDLTGGSSGGPWFQDFNAVEGVGTVVSLNSFKYRSDKGTMYGPYFGAYAKATYEFAKGVSNGGGHFAVQPPN